MLIHLDTHSQKTEEEGSVLGKRQYLYPSQMKLFQGKQNKTGLLMKSPVKAYQNG